MIYFIQLGDDGPIKIGKAKDVSTRFYQLQCAHPETLTLLCVIEGDKDKEDELHDLFLNLKIRGEWFSPESELLNYIQSLVPFSGPSKKETIHHRGICGVMSSNGQACLRYRAVDSRFCKAHSPDIETCKATTGYGEPCNNPPVANGLCRVHDKVINEMRRRRFPMELTDLLVYVPDASE